MTSDHSVANGYDLVTFDYGQLRAGVVISCIGQVQQSTKDGIS